MEKQRERERKREKEEKRERRERETSMGERNINQFPPINILAAVDLEMSLFAAKMHDMSHSITEVILG